MTNRSNENWVDVASAADIGEGEAREFVVGQQILAVFRQDDTWFALDGLCAHQGGPIAQGSLATTDQGEPCVTCPWHGWQYELRTGIQTINRQPLQRTFPVRVRDGRVEVHVGPGA